MLINLQVAAFKFTVAFSLLAVRKYNLLNKVKINVQHSCKILQN